MTTEFIKAKRLDSIAKMEAKKMRYCGFKATAKCDWANDIFGVTVQGITDEDYAGLVDYQTTGAISNEILILR